MQFLGTNVEADSFFFLNIWLTFKDRSLEQRD